jgi:dTDP-4-dehydrorhamnose reductase
MLRLGAERDQLSVVDDQRGTPTSAGFLAKATAQIADTWLKPGLPRSRQRGVFHLTAAGDTTWYGFAKAIFQEATANGLLPKVPLVLPITTAAYPTPATRPAWSVLDTTRTLASFGVEPPDWRSDLRKVLKGYYETVSST